MTRPGPSPDDLPEHANVVQAQQLAELLIVEPALDELQRDVGPVGELVEAVYPVVVAEPVLGSEPRPRKVSLSAPGVGVGLVQERGVERPQLIRELDVRLGARARSALVAPDAHVVDTHDVDEVLDVVHEVVQRRVGAFPG